MAGFRTLDDVNVTGKTVLVRVDLNVPMKDGRITDDLRISRILPTLHELSRKGAKVVVLSHFGRPDGKPVSEMSLKPVAAALATALGSSIPFAEDCVGEPARAAIARLKPGGVVLLENTRFHAEEEKNDLAFAKQMAALGDIYVNDAFSCAHRAHVSTEAVAHLLPAYAGRNMEVELKHLEAALDKPEKPVAAVIGGAKVSTKLELLGNLLGKVDKIIIGGGMANTFLFAQGREVGKSLCEKNLADTARDILRDAVTRGCAIILPDDVVVAREFRQGAPSKVVPAERVPADTMILDIGPVAAARLGTILADCKTLVWNGPLGAFETPPFDAGTVTVARTAAALTASGRLLSVAGGGDTVAALRHAGVAEEFSYVSTAGGAFLEWLEGKELPGVAALAAPAAVAAK
ncbi:MAG: phosphoglycerate kinase [Ferrovibrio sp.]|uniref:phosphoglycerate kinase n=1 Tax=Ferrovibrio sp. TaxID=1917215 RepID=UPI002638620B|nr:phosphoglycerate kinase [Ferrovibrio sp.]MCW0232397.1 phosphoglycerate kinase [Ferrovibrio sp.]